MTYLVDTNVLLRSVQPTHAMHQAASHAIDILLRQGEEICIISQVLIEFWAVATRPIANNGLDFDIETTVREIEEFKQLFTFLDDTPTIFTEWEILVEQYRVIGKKAHDARLVAAMKAHNLTHLLTFNADDFKRFANITIVNPADVA